MLVTRDQHRPREGRGEGDKFTHIWGLIAILSALCRELWFGRVDAMARWGSGDDVEGSGQRNSCVESRGAGWNATGRGEDKCFQGCFQWSRIAPRGPTEWGRRNTPQSEPAGNVFFRSSAPFAPTFPNISGPSWRVSKRTRSRVSTSSQDCAHLKSTCHCYHHPRRRHRSPPKKKCNWENRRDW